MEQQAPTHYLAAEHINDSSHIQTAFSTSNIGYVIAQKLVGCQRRKTLDAIGRLCLLSMVTMNLRFVLARMPCSAISLRTRYFPVR